LHQAGVLSTPFTTHFLSYLVDYVAWKSLDSWKEIFWCYNLPEVSSWLCRGKNISYLVWWETDCDVYPIFIVLLTNELILNIVLLLQNSHGCLTACFHLWVFCGAFWNNWVRRWATWRSRSIRSPRCDDTMQMHQLNSKFPLGSRTHGCAINSLYTKDQLI
jgi:hypothetical protein